MDAQALAGTVIAAAADDADGGWSLAG